MIRIAELVLLIRALRALGFSKVIWQKPDIRIFPGILWSVTHHSRRIKAMT